LIARLGIELTHWSIYNSQTQLSNYGKLWQKESNSFCQ
jgi:hypothetical protein